MPLNVADNFVVDIPSDFPARHPHLKSLARQLSIKYARKMAVTEIDLKTVGTALWEALDVPGPFEAARRGTGGKILPLILRSGSPEVLSLPWECLCHPELGFLGMHDGFTLSRQIPDAVSERGGAPPAGPLKVLLFTSLPDDLDAEKERLNTEAEQENVIEALDPWVREGRAELTCPDDGRFSVFRRLLRDEEFHLVFLSGHGMFRENTLADKPSQSFFIFEGEDGRSDPREAGEIAEAFAGTGVRCAVLSACLSGRIETARADREAELNAGLALRLFQAGLPHVAGMRESIYDAAGILFSRTFCDAVVRGERIDTAVQAARKSISGPFVKTGSPRRDRAEIAAAELGAGQWCLPALYTRGSGLELADKDFTPEEKPFEILLNDAFQEIQVPQRFIGRRMELRKLDRRLIDGEIRRLLVTGPGGQGKTSLAGRLAKNLEKRGFRIHGFSARPPADWERFVSGLKFSLDEKLGEEVDRHWGRCRDEEQKALLVLTALQRQTGGKTVLFFDNLETVQDPDTGCVSDEKAAAWLKACARMGTQSPTVLATSRWNIPGFADDLAIHHALQSSSYDDFLRFGQEFPRAGLSRKQMKTLHQEMGGNFKGLELFCAATRLGADPDSFLQRLARKKEDLRVYMTVEETVALLHQEELELLDRLRAYVGPVLEDGVKVVSQDLSDPAVSIRRLAALSLVDAEFDPDLRIRQYSLSPLIAGWLEEKRAALPADIAQQAARYQVYVFENMQNTLDRAMAAHAALTRAGLGEDAHRFFLRYLFDYFKRRGMFRTLLDVWLPPLLESQDLSIRGVALNNCGATCKALGDFDGALDYLEQSLAILREIGDRAGEGVTLNNISQIYHAQSDYDAALNYLTQSLTILRETGHRAGEGQSLSNISLIYHACGDYDAALDYLTQSLAILREIGDRAGEGTTLNNIGNIYQARGDYDAALHYLTQSLTIRREIGDRAGEGVTLNNIGLIYDARGNYDAALDYLTQSLAIHREIGDRVGEGQALNNISQIYKACADYDAALDYLTQSLSIVREIGDRAGEGTTLNNISQIYDARSDYDAALDYLTKSLAIRREIGNRAGEGTTLNNIGQIYTARGDYDAALDYLTQSLAIQREIGDRAGMCITLFNIGHILWQNQDRPQAILAWAQSYGIASKIGHAQVLQALEGLAKQLVGDGLEFWEKELKSAGLDEEE